jgi:hypothetical protein
MANLANRLADNLSQSKTRKHNCKLQPLAYLLPQPSLFPVSTGFAILPQLAEVLYILHSAVAKFWP